MSQGSPECSAGENGHVEEALELEWPLWEGGPATTERSLVSALALAVAHQLSVAPRQTEGETGRRANAYR